MSTILAVVNGTKIYGTPTGIKITSRGKVQKPEQLFSELPKSERRKIRKAARKLNLIHIARS